MVDRSEYLGNANQFEGDTAGWAICHGELRSGYPGRVCAIAKIGLISRWSTPVPV